MYSYTAFPTIDMKRTGQRIAQLRRARGLSVRDVQEYFGFEYPQAIYKWQWGESLPSVDNLFALARLLDVNMQDLLVENDREVSPFWREEEKLLRRLWKRWRRLYFRLMRRSSRRMPVFRDSAFWYCA